MPRKNPIEGLQAEEAAPNSPIRRSTRISTTSTPTRVMTRRTSSDSVTTAATPKATKSRRLSASQESNGSKDEPTEDVKPTSKTRRAGSVTRSVEKDTEKEETLSKPRTRRSSVTKEDQQEVKKPATRRRSSSTTDIEDTPVMLTRTRSGSISKETSDNKPILQRRRSSLTGEIVNSPVVSSLKRTTSMDSINVLDAIKEVDKDEDSPKAQKGRKKKEVNNLDLSVINESSFFEEPEKLSAENNDSEKYKSSETSFTKETAKSKTPDSSFVKDLDKSKSTETSCDKEPEKSKTSNTSFVKDLDKSKSTETSFTKESEKSKASDTSFAKDLNKSKSTETSSVNDSETTKNVEAGSVKSSEKSFVKNVDESKTGEDLSEIDHDQTGESIHLPLNSTIPDSSNQGEANNNSFNNSSDKENDFPQKDSLPLSERLAAIKNVFAEKAVDNLDPSEPMEVDECDVADVDSKTAQVTEEITEQVADGSTAENKTTNETDDDELILNKSVSPSFDGKWSSLHERIASPRRSPRINSSKSDQQLEGDKEENSTPTKKKVSLDKGEITTKNRLSLKKTDESLNVEVDEKTDSSSLAVSKSCSVILSECKLDGPTNKLLKSPVVKLIDMNLKVASPRESKDSNDTTDNVPSKEKVIFEESLLENFHISNAATEITPEKRTSLRKSNITSENNPLADSDENPAVVQESTIKTTPVKKDTPEKGGKSKVSDVEKLEKSPQILEKPTADEVSDAVEVGTSKLDISEMLATFKDVRVGENENTQLVLNKEKSVVEISDDDEVKKADSDVELTSFDDDTLSKKQDDKEVATSKGSHRKSNVGKEDKKRKRVIKQDSSDDEPSEVSLSKLVNDDASTECTENSSNGIKDSGEVIDAEEYNLSESEVELTTNTSDFPKQYKDSDVRNEITSLINEQAIEGSSDSESESAYNQFIDNLAEEGEEDTPSEGSNDIVDLGESINTTESELTSNDDYETGSFVTDEEQFELLSGNEEFDISLETTSKRRKERKSRIIKPADSSDEALEVTSEKQEGSPLKTIRSRNSNDGEAKIKSKKRDSKSQISPVVCSRDSSGNTAKSRQEKSPRKSRIIRPTDSSDEEPIEEKIIDIGTRIERKLSISNDAEEIAADLVGPSDANKEILSFSSSVLAKDSEVDNGVDESPRTKKTSSIIIHENIRVDVDQHKRLSDRIHKFVDLFCSNIKRDGEVSVNVSLDYAGKSSDEENADISKISTRKSTESMKSEENKEDLLPINTDEVVTPKEVKQKPVTGVSNCGLLNLSVGSDNVFHKNQDKEDVNTTTTTPSKKKRTIEVSPKKVASPASNETAKQVLPTVPVVEKKKKSKKTQDDSLIDQKEEHVEEELVDAIPKKKRKRSRKNRKHNKEEVVDQIDSVTGEETIEENIIEQPPILSKKDRKRKSSDIEVPIPIKKSKKVIESFVKNDEENAVTESRAPKRKLAKLLIEPSEDRKEIVKKQKVTGQKLLQKETMSVLNKPLFEAGKKQMVPEYKPKAVRVQSGWTIEKTVVQPSVSNVYQGEKFHPKDFKNKMIYDSTRVKRMDTKQMLKKGSSFI